MNIKKSLCLILATLYCSLCLHIPQGLGMSLTKQPKAYQVALHTFGFWNEEQKLKLDVALWYPGQTQTRIAEYDGWLVQACSHRQSVAKVIPGFYPVILLSHDTASSYFANNDVAAHLASQGFFVIVPAHTGDTTTNGDAIYQAKLLQDRPLQLLKALELVLANEHFAPFVDESRIGLLGVGAGAVTAAQLTGMVPQAQLLTSYCRENSTLDYSCAGWTPSLLKKFELDYTHMLQQQFPHPFTPPLNFFAPKELEIVPIPPEEPEEMESLLVEEADDAGNETEQEKKSLLTKLKDLFKSTLPESETETLATAKVPPPAVPQVFFDFHGGIIQTETFMGNPFVLFKTSDNPAWIYSVTLPEKEPESILPPLQKKKDTRPYRRPSDVRTIKAIAFLAPTGAYYFDSTQPNTSLPALSIFPEYSTLYPHVYQAEPYHQLFPSYHEVEVIGDTDHFSLFASCTEQSRALLPENCGNLNNEEKEATDKKKLDALRLFFKQYLGDPLGPQPPTGLKAVDD